MIYLLHYLIYPIIALLFIIALIKFFKLFVKNNKILSFIHLLITFISIAIFSTFITDDIRIVVAQTIEIFSISLLILLMGVDNE